MPDLTTLAAIATALAAVIVSPWVINRTTTRQIRANLVSANRQAWIDKLRDEVAELFELLTWHYLQRPGTLSGEEGYKYEAEKRSRIRFLMNKIRLRLNPLEAESQAFIELLNQLRVAAVGREDLNFDELMEKAITRCQSILKTEWIRVKKGE